MRWLAGVMRLTVLSVIVSAVSVTTTLVVVQAYIQQMLQQTPLAGVFQPLSLGGVLSSLSGGDHPTSPTPTPAEVSEPEAQGQQTPTSRPEPSQDALEVMGRIERSEESGADTFNEEWVLSMEELNERKDRLTAEERMEIFSILMSRMPQDEVQHISELLENGITSEEVEQASEILKTYLTQEEYDRFIRILLE